MSMILLNLNKYSSVFFKYYNNIEIEFDLILDFKVIYNLLFAKEASVELHIPLEILN
jgi:hypothetical protein